MDVTSDLSGRPTEEWLAIYRRMQLVRQFEELSVRLFRAGELPGFVHPSVGQEAVAVGMTHGLTDADMLTSTHRGHGHVLAKGLDPTGVLAELYGRETGTCRGRGGSMHVMDLEHGVLGANGIVGGGIPIAVGAALAIQIDGDERVVVAFFGDGAVNTGSFHEALNLAGLWKLPIVFVCENNQYAESTAFKDSIPTDDLLPRAVAYGMQGRVVDGNDIVACVEAASEAFALARSGGGPTLIQADTYRWYGHHTGDTAPYRTDEELASWKARDPIAGCRAALLAAGVEEETIAAIEAEVADDLSGAEDAARSAPDPDPSELLHGVLAEVVA